MLQKDIKDQQDGQGEDDEESMDWWTKYHASVDLMIKVGGIVSPVGCTKVCTILHTTHRRQWGTGPRRVL